MATTPKSTDTTSDAPRLSLSGSNDGKWIVNYTGPIDANTADDAYAVVNSLVAKIKAEHGEAVKGYGRPSAAKPAAGGAARPRANAAAGRPAPAASRDPIFCAVCDSEIKPVTFKDGKTFTAQQVAGWGLKNFDMALCSNDYQKAKNGELDLSGGDNAVADKSQDVPF